MRGFFAVAVLAPVLAFIPAAFGQTAAAPASAPSEVLAAIDRDIWIPFRKAYGEDDVEAYVRLHRPEFIRVEANRKRVLNLADYAESMRAFFARERERGSRFTIDFRFTERLATKGLAHEKGVFAFTSIPKQGAPRKFYGRFHTAARLDAGTWKFVLDYDSNEKGAVGEAEFNAAFAADDYSRY